MRSCDEIVELISASLDGELTAEEQTALDEHIVCCPACSALLEDLRALHAAASDWEDIPAPAGFTEAVMSAIAAQAAPKSPDNVIPFAPRKAMGSHWKKWGLSAAAIAIVVLGAVSAPSLTGNFAHKAAAPESADMAYARNDNAAEAVMDMVAPQDSAYNYSATEEMYTETAEKSTSHEMAPAEKPAASSAPGSPAEIPTCDEKPNVELYVGELILEEPLEILKEYEGIACSDGTATYLVPAEVFSGVFNLLETEKPVGYAYTAGNPDAELGKIVAPIN